MTWIIADFVVVDSYDYDPAVDSSEVMETASQLCPSLHNQDTGTKIMVTSQVDGDKDHLMALARAMCRIMAYRVKHCTYRLMHVVVL